MKKLSKFLTLLTGVTLLTVFPCMIASAATTFQVKFISNEKGWEYQTGTVWDEDAESSALYYLNNGAMQDGDIIVVNGTGATEHLNLSKSPSNITFMAGSYGAVNAPSVTDVYVCRDATASVGGKITNAYVYDRALASFPGDVDHITLYEQDTYEITAAVSCAGVVKHFTTDILMPSGSKFDYYNFLKGTLAYDDGYLRTPSGSYSTTPSEASNVAAAPATSAGASAPATAPASNDLDNVPKTGETSSVLWLLTIAMACLGGKYLIRKTM